MKNFGLGLAKNVTKVSQTVEISLPTKTRFIKVLNLSTVLIVTTNVPEKRICMFILKIFMEKKDLDHPNLVTNVDSVVMSPSIDDYLNR